MEIKAQRGFTLYELMVTMMVVGVLFGVGIPNLIGMIRDNRMAAAANDIVSLIYAARSEAVKEQRLVTFCASTNPEAATPICAATANGTNDRGFVVFIDDADGDGIDPTDGNLVVDPGERIVLQRAAAGGTLNLFADQPFISYAPNGFVAPAVGTPSLTTILLCDERGNRDIGGRSAARVINVTVIGRPQTMSDVADVTTATTANGWSC
jgi:type IV fimbrial biogenesis protein FimT